MARQVAAPTFDLSTTNQPVKGGTLPTKSGWARLCPRPDCRTAGGRDWVGPCIAVWGAC